MDGSYILLQYSIGFIVVKTQEQIEQYFVVYTNISTQKIENLFSYYFLNRKLFMQLKGSFYRFSKVLVIIFCKKY